MNADAQLSSLDMRLKNIHNTDKTNKLLHPLCLLWYLQRLPWLDYHSSIDPFWQQFIAY